MTKGHCAGCFRSLSEETRIQMVQELKKRPMNVQMVQKGFSLSQPTITHHLQKLEQLGIVKREKRGREVWYSYNRKFACDDCDIFPRLG